MRANRETEAGCWREKFIRGFPALAEKFNGIRGNADRQDAHAVAQAAYGNQSLSEVSVSDGNIVGPRRCATSRKSIALSRYRFIARASLLPFRYSSRVIGFPARCNFNLGANLREISEIFFLISKIQQA